jgi:hypothetical protein
VLVCEEGTRDGTGAAVVCRASPETGYPACERTYEAGDFPTNGAGPEHRDAGIPERIPVVEGLSWIVASMPQALAEVAVELRYASGGCHGQGDRSFGNQRCVSVTVAEHDSAALQIMKRGTVDTGKGNEVNLQAHRPFECFFRDWSRNDSVGPRKLLREIALILGDRHPMPGMTLRKIFEELGELVGQMRMKENRHVCLVYVDCGMCTAAPAYVISSERSRKDSSVPGLPQ